MQQVDDAKKGLPDTVPASELRQDPADLANSKYGQAVQKVPGKEPESAPEPETAGALEPARLNDMKFANQVSMLECLLFSQSFFLPASKTLNLRTYTCGCSHTPKQHELPDARANCV